MDASGEGRIGQTNWTMKVEYLYMDLGSDSGAFGATGAPVKTLFGLNNSDYIHFITTTTSFAGTAVTHVTDNIVRVGLNYKFPPQQRDTATADCTATAETPLAAQRCRCAR